MGTDEHCLWTISRIQVISRHNYAVSLLAPLRTAIRKVGGGKGETNRWDRTAYYNEPTAVIEALRERVSERVRSVSGYYINFRPRLSTVQFGPAKRNVGRGMHASVFPARIGWEIPFDWQIIALEYIVYFCFVSRSLNSQTAKTVLKQYIFLLEIATRVRQTATIKYWLFKKNNS